MDLFLFFVPYLSIIFLTPHDNIDRRCVGELTLFTHRITVFAIVDIPLGSKRTR